MCDTHMKKPCKDCPFLRSREPFLHPDRAYEIAEAANHRWNTFTCHKTLDYDDENDEMYTGETSKECAGFLTLKAKLIGMDAVPDDFEPAFDEVYDDEGDMENAYYEQWNKK